MTEDIKAQDGGSANTVKLVIAILFVIAGVAVTLLWLVQEVGKDVGNVDRGEGVSRGGGSIITPK